MPAVTLSDEHRAIIEYASLPLDRRHRKAFADTVVAALADVPMVGAGAVFRVCAEQQKKFFAAPKFATALSAPRPRR